MASPRAGWLGVSVAAAIPLRHLRHATRKVALCAALVADLYESPADRSTTVRRLRRLQRAVHERTHATEFALRHTTLPDDQVRQALQRLIRAVDEFADELGEAGKRLEHYQLGASTEQSRRVARIIEAQASLVAATLPRIVAGESTGPPSALVDLSNMGERARELIAQAQEGRLGADSINGTIRTLRWRDIYALLMEVVARGESVGSALDELRAALEKGGKGVEGGS